MGIQILCSKFVSLVSGFCGIKKTDGFAFPVARNSGHPFFVVFMPSHASITRGTVLRRWSIFLILLVRSQTKIAQSVVRFVAVDVINVITGGDMTKHVNPNDALGSITFGVNRQHNVPSLIFASSLGVFHHV